MHTLLDISRQLNDYIKTKYSNDIASLASLKINRMTDDAIENKILGKSGNNYLTFVELIDGHRDNLLHSCGGRLLLH